ncbi:M16 family metallopeptidase [Desulfuribacillus alkaliarsenatis]|uniref:Zinc protease n=1 Tax=Desulfuribacillus alkaliarsenatis TaxID=766136 RepID=A0A1E5G655_9FIRM|nr:pitrilysin family protein [Desulfuribacillus alkaliarsenatis]OEF98656.1 zinc protease [Desulfuribacillus alkaliarsenatis]
MIEKKTLENGVRIVVEKIPTVRSVSLGIWIGAGSRHEAKGNNGISHFIEHMMFKGTEKLTAKQIAETFDSIGGQINALTSKEYTCYYAKVIDDHFDLAIEVLADMFFNSKFDEADIDKERGVVLEELSMYEDTPDDLVHDLIGQASFGEHPLGSTILGTREVLHNLNREMIVNYISENYTANNIVITIAGNVNDSVFEKVASLFSSLKGERPKPSKNEISLLKNKVVLNKKTEQAHICLANNGYAVGDKSMYTLAIINNILGGSMSSRLFQEIREQRGLAYSVYSYHSAFYDNGMYVSYLGTSPKHVKEAIEVITSIYKDLHNNGISKEELNKAKEQLKGMLMLSLESTTSRMNRLGKNELLLEKQIDLDETIAKINEVTLEHAKDVCNQVFKDKSTIAAIGPFDDIDYN